MHKMIELKASLKKKNLGLHILPLISMDKLHII